MEGSNIRPSRWVGAALVAAGFSCASCGSHTEAPFENFMPDIGSAATVPANGDAYEEYLSAAQQFTTNLGKHRAVLEKSWFSPNEQDWIETAAKQPIQILKRGFVRPCHIPPTLPGSNSSLKGREAWRLLSKVLIWRIQRACGEHAFEGAIQSAALATKFGFDLTAGSPHDATLGLLIVDEARKALAPNLGEMSPGQLDLLTHDLKRLYLNRPSLTPCLEAAGRDSLAEVQSIQDVYRSERYETLATKVGTTAKEIIPTLKELHRQPDNHRVAFFKGLAKEANDEIERANQDSQLPVAERPVQPPLPTGQERPWRKISRRLFGISKPLIAMNDATCARTALLILEAQIVRTRKTTGKTPPDLSRFSAKLTQDPYSGQSFIYRTEGSDYKLYSTGADLIDNDGETDETYTRPDLMLERSRRS